MLPLPVLPLPVTDTALAQGPPPLAITTASLPDGDVGCLYSHNVTATGGSGTYNWSIISGSLPAGLSISPSTGNIYGTPTSETSTSGNSTSAFGLNSGDRTWVEGPNILDAMRFQNTIGMTQASSMANMTNPAAGAAGAVYNGKLYVFGGYGASETDYLSYTQMYNPGNNSWTQRATMPTARWGAAAAVYNGKIYVFGGTVSGLVASNKCEIYDPVANSWGNGTSVPVTLDNGVMAVTVGSYIYIFYLNNYVYKFDPSGNGGLGSYAALTAPPTASQKKWADCAYVSVSSQDRIYIIGGSTSDGTFTNTNYYYVPGNNAWSSAQAAAPYAGAGVTRDNPVYNGKIYYGYGDTVGAFMDCIYFYDPSANTWSYQLGSGTARDVGACGFIGDTLYYVGGRNVADNPYGIALNEAYQAVVPSPWAITQLQILFDTGSPSGSVHLGVYADSNGQPGDRMADTEVAVANGWVTASVGNLTVYSGCYYWLAFELSAPNGVRYQSSGQPTNSHAYQTLASYQALPYSLSFGNYNSTPYVMRAVTPTGNFTVQLSDGSNTATKPLSIKIWPALSVATSSLPNGQVGSYYSQTLAASGGNGTYIWSLYSGNLPDGLSLNSSTGMISGTASAAGRFSFSVQVTDGICTATGVLSIIININAPTPTITWANPADIVYGTALSGTQLNASASYQGSTVQGTFVYTPALGTVLQAGNGQTLHVDFTPTDTLDYNSASGNVTINVQKAPLTVTADGQTKVYGQANPAFTATATGMVGSDTLAGLSLGYTLSSTATTTSPVGNYTITFSGGLTSTANYSPITYVSGSLSVTRAPLTVTADNKSKVYGQPNPALTATATGLVGSDTLAGLNLGYTLSTTATDTSPVGSYPISFSGGLTSTANYSSIVYVSGSLSVTQATYTFGLDSGYTTYENPNIIDAMRFQNTVGIATASTMASMPHASADLPGVVYNGKLYVFGGYGANDVDCLKYTQIYDPTTDNWTQGAPMPTARWGAAAAQYGGKIYVFGGDNGPTTCEIYNVTANSWTTGTPIPSEMGNGVMAVTLGSKIYIFRYQYVYIFDPTGNRGLGSYTTGTPPPVGKKWATCAYVNVSGQDRIYIIGGSTSDGTFTDTNYYYIPGNDSWSSAQAAAPYAAHGVTRDNPAYNGKIYYGYGLTASQVFSGSIYCYDPSTNTWSYQLCTGLARDGGACGVIGSTLYYVGGRNASSCGVNYCGLNCNEAYQAGATSPSYKITGLQMLFDNSAGIQPSGSAHLGVYADSNGQPGNLMVDRQVTVANGWVTASGLNVTVVSGCYYWLAFELSALNGVQIQYVKPASVYQTLPSYQSLPNELSPGGSTRMFVMRAVVTAANLTSLTITANNTSKTYGDTVTFAGTEFTASGLVNGDTVSSVTLTSAGAAATATVADSPYQIVPSNAVGTGLDKYNITYVNGNLTVNKAPLTVTADNKSKIYGQANPTFTASATGLVGSDTLAGLSLGYTLSTTATTTSPVASYPITFSGGLTSTANYSPITYVSGSLSVTQASTTTPLTSSVNPSVFGQSVTFTATVTAAAPGSGTPTGTVTFKDGSTTLGNGTLQSNGNTTFSTSALSVGNHTITATYNGDGNFTASTSVTLSQVVNKANTSTAVISSVNPSVFRQSVTLTATVTATAPGSGTPTGTVTFKDGSTTLGNGTLQINGNATFSTSALSVGNHTITATYNGDGNFTASTSAALSQVVNKANTSTAVISSVNPSVFGQSVTLTATVTATAPGSGTPTGTVTFKDGSTTLGTGTLSSGKATFTTTSLSVATHSITAVYGGSSNYNGSTSVALSQVVNKANTSTAVISSRNPSRHGQSVTFTATVTATAPGSGTPTGTVTFKDGSRTLGTGTLNGSGKASFATTSLSVGTHSITAVYGGSSSYNASTSPALSQVVN